MRLFIGVKPDPGFRAALADLQDRLRLAGVTGRYLDPVNLHMTLAFIGEWPEADAVPLPVPDCPFPIRLAPPGIFREAKVLWAGVRPSDALGRLAGEARRLLAEAGMPFDRKAFYPHITLVRKPVVPEGLDLSGIRVPEAGMLVRASCLFLSERGEAGMQYTVIRQSAQAPG